MYTFVIKPWLIVGFAICGVFSIGVNTVKSTQNTQVEFLVENSACDCGNNGPLFSCDDQNKCNCAEYYFYKDDKCFECDCGNNGELISCDWIDDEKKCNCPEYEFQKDGKCLNPCSDNPCKNEGVCKVNDKDYVCDCKQPYIGKQCDMHACLSNPCLNDGACVAVENSYGCVCTEPFHGRHCQNGPCSPDPCQHEGVCSVAGIDFNCSCKPPYSGKQCEINCDCGPDSTGCHWENGTKVCSCKGGHAQGEDGMCQACDCGKNAYDCSFKNGRKVCHCNLNYAELEGKCIDCVCESGGLCEFEEGVKTCSCFPHQRYFRGKCTYCYCGEYANDCGFFDDGKMNCNCQEGYIQRDDYCKEINSTGNENITTDLFTTGLTTITGECYCGVNSVSCHLDWQGKKVCKCKDSSHVQRNEICAATCNSDSDCLNGGRCRREGVEYFCQCVGVYTGDRCETDVCDSMRYKCNSMGAECRRRGDLGVCECPAGTSLSWLSDTCVDICDYRTCLHGRCEVTGNSSYVCICDDGYYGRHCEISTRVISPSGPWALLITFAIGIVIFSVFALVAARWVKKLRKIIEEDAKKLRNAS